MRTTPVLFTSCLLAALLMGCSKEKDPEPTAPANSGPGPGYAMTIDSPVGAYFMMDGQEVILDAQDWWAEGGGCPHPINGMPFAACVFRNEPDSLYWRWAFGRTPIVDPLPLSEVLALFSPGPRPYIMEPDMENGVTFDHNDTSPAGYWNVGCGMDVGDQSGSEFVIEDFQFVDAAVDTFKVLARFNCKLYECTPPGPGTRTITHGRLRFDLACP